DSVAISGAASPIAYLKLTRPAVATTASTAATASHFFGANPFRAGLAGGGSGMAGTENGSSGLKSGAGCDGSSVAVASGRDNGSPSSCVISGTDSSGFDVAGAGFAGAGFATAAG